VSTRVSPTEQLRAEIDDLFGESDEERQLGDTLEEVARLGARLLLQSALEAEVTEFLCRNRYERRKLAKDARAGSRNGYSDLTVKTTAGPVTLKRPKLRGTTEQFASRLLGKGVTKTNALESLVIAGFIRGLSVRDVEAALAEALGPEATVSKSTAATSSTTLAPRPSPYSSPGGSPRPASRCSCTWPRAPLSPPTPGRGSSRR
jgi:transposase-like protein